MIRRLKRRLSRSTSCPDRYGAHEWDADRAVIASSGLPFRVKYLGSAEVPQARGIEMCDSVVEYFHPPTSKGKKKMILNVSTEGIRVVEEQSKALVFDQPIEKVSFCAPNRTYTRCFSYIARDGATQKWICHCFVTVLPVTGERLSHAVGASFALCLQKRQREARNLGLQRQSSATAEIGGLNTRRSSSASASVRSAASAPAMPSHNLEELYATVNKPQRFASVNENNPTDHVDGGEPARNSLMMEPSVALTPIIYRRQQPPQQEIQQVAKPTNINPWEMVTIPAQTSISSDPWQVQSSTTQPPAIPIVPPQQQATRRQSASQAPRPPSGLADTEPTTSEAVSTSSDPWVPRPHRPLQRRPSKADQWLDNMITQTAVEAARRSTSPSISEDVPFQDVFQPLSERDPFQPIQTTNTRDLFQPLSSSNTRDPFQLITSQFNDIAPRNNPDPFQPMESIPRRSQSGERKPISDLSFDDLEASYLPSLANGSANQDNFVDGDLPWKPISSQPTQARYNESDEWEVVTTRHLRSQAFPDGRQDYFS